MTTGFVKQKRQDALAKRWAKFLTNMLNEFEYSEIDVFIEDNNMNEEEINFISELSVKVILEDM